MRTVFVSGVFDLITPGHIEHLRWARSLGDRLIVSVGADETAAAFKRRPMQSADDRRLVLSALRCVDMAVIAPVETERPWADCLPVIQEWRPQVWALGPDDPHERDKAQAAGWLGIDVIRQPGPKSYSTTALIERAAERARRVDVETPTGLHAGIRANTEAIEALNRELNRAAFRL